MINFLIGHRGVGKTSLLQRLKNYFPQEVFFDLDEEIETREKKKISQIFLQSGEHHFRQLEYTCLQTLLVEHKKCNESKNIWISLGAGFELEKFFESQDAKLIEFQVYWIRRSTDSMGRIFVDRPRLNNQVRPLEEWQQKFSTREKMYLKMSHYIYEMPEGIKYVENFSSKFESRFFSHDFNETKSVWNFKHNNCVITLEPSLCELRKLKALKDLQNKFNFLIELRDDLLTEEEFTTAVSIFFPTNCVYSLRRNRVNENYKNLLDVHGDRFAKIDFDYRVFNNYKKYFLDSLASDKIVSFHESDIEKLKSIFEDVLASLEKSSLGVHYKFSPVVNSFDELMNFEKFLSTYKNKYSISFLPRSEKSMLWDWYRLLQFNNNKINFIKYFNGSAKDQPTLFQSAMFLDINFDFNCDFNFAALIGNPIQHSLSASFHYDFFKNNGLPYFRIAIAPEEFECAIEYLCRLGLRFVSITAPFKNSILSLESSLSKNSVNTACFLQTDKESKLHSNNGKGLNLIAINTDKDAILEVFKGLLEKYSSKDLIAVWGGGGILESLGSLNLNLDFFSARIGDLKENSYSNVRAANYDVVIWALPFNHQALPPKEWQPRLIIDLNYSENSQGREYFQMQDSQKCQYVSGLSMFETQALKQQEFWRTYVGK